MLTPNRLFFFLLLKSFLSLICLVAYACEILFLESEDQRPETFLHGKNVYNPSRLGTYLPRLQSIQNYTTR